MPWETIFSQVYTVEANTERITLPVTFSPYFRLIISTSLLTGLGSNERFLGTLSQQLNIPEIGEVKGRSLALSPSLQLLTPATEFPYKLVYQPVRGQQFSFELEIQVELTVGASSNADIAPVLVALAAVQTTLDNLPLTGEGADYTEALAAIQASVDALPTEGGDTASALASLIANQDEIRGDLSGVTEILLALNSGQNALIEQTTGLQTTLDTLATTGGGTGDTSALAAIQTELTTVGAQVAEVLAFVTPVSLRPYTPTLINPVAFYENYDLTGLNDGVQDITVSTSEQRGAKGTMVSANACQIKLSFAVPTVIRKIRLLVGQFNGPYNLPSGFTLYRGEGTDQIVYSKAYQFTANDYYYFKEFDVGANKIASSVYRLDFVSNAGISISELQVLGF